MKRANIIAAIIAMCVVVMGATHSFSDSCNPRACLPEHPIPPESVGSIPVPFDLPIWPTLIKTEFHILPWVTFGKASICLPGTCRSVEIPAPCFSLKPVPFWFPWLRPLDAECSGTAGCRVP